MLAEGPRIQPLSGDRLHLQHGPIDVVLRAWGRPDHVAAAYRAVAACFPTILGELVGELGELRRAMATAPEVGGPQLSGPRVSGPVARRMVSACRPFAGVFLTPMAAVAGAVADELLAAMVGAAPLARAFVNDGGDIAVHLAPGQSLAIGIADDPGLGHIPAMTGRVTLSAGDRIGGIATSGRGGRSFSLGIADAVTVLARDAATADAAATLIANAVTTDSPAIARAPACDLAPDSDLGARLVTVGVGPLSPDEIAAALEGGRARAEGYVSAGLVAAAALTLRGQTITVGGGIALPGH